MLELSIPQDELVMFSFAGFSFLALIYFIIIRSYLTGRAFKLKDSGAYLSLYCLYDGVLEYSIVVPILNMVYTSDIAIHPTTIITTYSDEQCV